MPYDIGPKIGVEGEAKFRKSIRDINSSLKAMTAEMKAVTSAYEDGDESQEKLRKQNELLNRQIEVQKTKLSELSAMLEKSKDKYGETDEKTQKWKRAVNDATTELNKLERELFDNTKALKKADDATEQLKKEQEKLANEVEHTSEKLNRSSESLKAININAAIATTALAAMGFVAGKVGSDFESQMSRVESISSANVEQMKSLESTAKEMGESTQFSATESGKALEYMAMAGWETNQMIDGLPGVMNLAAASGEELALVSDILTDSLTAFKLEASDSAHFADILAKTSSSANTNVSMLGETFKYAAPVAGSLGYEVEDVAVAIGLMANAGIKGEKSGTALRGMLTNLAKPTKQSADYMDKLGISMKNSNGEVKPLNDLLTELRGGFAKLTDAQKAEYAAGIAGKNAMSGMLALVNASDDDFKKLTKQINNSAGAAEDMAKVTNDNLQGELKLLKSAAEGVGIAFYEKFDKEASGAVEKLTKKVAEFSKDLSSGELDSELNAITATAAGTTAGIIALNGALMYKDLQNFTVAMKAGSAGMQAYTASTVAGTVAQKAFNLAQLATPWGWAAIAAGAAGTALVTYAAMTHESTSEAELLKDRIEELNEELDAQIQKQDDLAEARENALANVEAEINIVSNYIDELKELTDANGKVIDGYEERAEFLSEQINELIPGAVSAAEDEAGAYYEVTQAIEDMIFAKKKEMVLAAWEEDYVEALKNRADAQDKLRQASEAQADAEAQLNEIRANANGMRGDGFVAQEIEAQRVLEASKAATEEAQQSLDKYNRTISGFNAATMAEDVDQLTNATSAFSKEIVKATGQNNTELQQNLVNLKTNLDEIVAEYGKTWDSMTDAEKRNAKDRIDEQKALVDEQVKEAKRAGVEIPENFSKSLSQENPKLSKEMLELFGNSVDGLEVLGYNLEDIAKSYAIIFQEGIASETENTEKAGQALGEDATAAVETGSEGISEAGTNFTLGFAEGIENKEAVKTAEKAAVNLATAVLVATQKTLDIHSPSRVMRDEVGVMVSRGVAVGIEDGIKFAKKATQKLGNAIADEIEDLNKELAKMEEAELKERAEKELAEYTEAIEEKYEELGKVEGEEKRKILDEIAKLQNEWNEKQIQAEKDAAKIALKEKISVLEEYKKEYDNALNELEQRQEDMADKLASYGDLLVNATNRNGREYLKLGDIQDEIDKIEEYAEALEELKNRGISDGLMSEITSMDIDDALDYTELLLKKSPKQFDEYVKLWEGKQKLARHVAKEFYQSEFDELQNEFVDKIPEELSVLKDGMEDIGKQSAIGLADGFWEQKSYIISTFTSVLESALSEAKASMEIHSPSRRWAEVGHYMAEGLGVGFTKQMKDVRKRISDSIPAGTESPITSNTNKAVAKMVNGLAPLVASNQGVSSPQIIQVMLQDGKVLAEAVHDPLKDISRRKGE